MKKSNTVKVITVIAIICVLIAIVVYGVLGNRKSTTKSADSIVEERTVSELIDADSFEKVDITDMAASYDEINAVYKCMDENEKVIGYVSFLTVEGYGGPMNVNIATDENGQKILNLRVGDNNETQESGKLVEKEEFYDQFDDVSIPVKLSENNKLIDEQVKSGLKLQDGTYIAKDDDYENEYKAEVEIQVEDGEIVSVNWDEKTKEGESKKNNSIKGEYNLNASELKWHEQVERVEDYLVKIQDPKRMIIDDDGKTDAVSSITIEIDTFRDLAEECVEQAMGLKYSEGSNDIQAVTGATVSSKAVVNAANIAGEFVSGNLNK